MSRNQNHSSDSIDIIDIIAIIYKQKNIIILSLLFFGMLAVFFTIATSADTEVLDGDTEVEESEIAPSIYTAWTYLYFEPFVQDVLENQGVRSIARSYGPLAAFMLERRTVFEPLRESTDTLDREILQALHNRRYDWQPNRYVLVFFVSHRDPQMAAFAANRAVELLRQRFSDLGIRHPTDDGDVFRVIQPAYIPSIPDAPESVPTVTEEDQRGSTSILFVFFSSLVAGLLFGMFFAFLRHWIQSVRNDPDAMRKIRGEK